MPALLNQMIELTPEETIAAKQNAFAAVRMVEKRTGAKFEDARAAVLAAIPALADTATRR